MPESSHRLTREQEQAAATEIIAKMVGEDDPRLALILLSFYHSFGYENLVALSEHTHPKITPHIVANVDTPQSLMQLLHRRRQ